MEHTLKEAVHWMRENQASASRRLERWCNQNSWSYDTPRLRLMAETLCNDFAGIGIEFHQLELPPLKLLGDEEQWVEQATGPALLWHHNAGAAKRLLLMIHYDTVYPHDSQPSKCRREGSKLIGPGTVDAKGGIAVIAMAVEAMLKYDLAGDTGVSILLNPDEEIGSTASRELMIEYARQFDAALVFEPPLPNGALVASRLGSGNFAFVCRGKSAHAGRNPDEGRNAIVHLSKLIPHLVELHKPDEGVLLNVGRIAGGGPLNRVPDHAVLKLNTRVVDHETMQQVEDALNDIAKRFTRDEYRITLNGMFSSPPKKLSEEMKSLQRQVEVAGALAERDIRWQNTGGACDGSKLAAFGLPNIDTMGLSGANLHSPDEFCDLEELVPAAHTVLAFIHAFDGC